MDPSMIVMLLAGLTVAGLIAGVGMLVGAGSNKALAERRLEEAIRGRAMAPAPKSAREAANASVIKAPAIDRKSPWTQYIPNVENFSLLYEQAAMTLDFNRFVLVVAAMAAFPVVLVGLLHFAGLNVLPWYVVPIMSAVFGMIPFAYLVHRKNSRISKFTAAMPEALELTARALRAGHGLGAGLKMVGDEMTGPIAEEFNRVFEEQNLGIPMEEALRGLAQRIPTMDVRFFVTAVVIQRSAGGDLGELLDKIGRIIRQRFEIKGQVAALTGEGRLSGAVLLAMPPGLLAYLFLTNPGYIMPLFTEPNMGRPMVIAAAVMQVLGAIAIKKIVDIKI